MKARGAEENNVAPLAERLRERIRREGALTFRDWMAAALYDPHEGYYVRRDRPRWGREGDYRTSPERSPLFAATFARYFATTLYEELGSPPKWTITEAGAGAGDFARGVLETLEHHYPHVFAATRYVIDEASTSAIETTQTALSSYNKRIEFRRLTETEGNASIGIIFNNELLDAFPIHRVTMRGSELCELYVGLDEDDAFTWIERAPSTPQLAKYFEQLGIRLAEGQTAEVNLDAGEWLRRAATSLKRGYIITVDYGAEAEDLYAAAHRPDGTLRAFQRHRFADDMLAQPGAQDLTSTVCWTQLRQLEAELNLQTICFERQDKFLLRAGLLEELERLTHEARDEAAALILRTGAREMILPGGMSESFQVLIQKKLAGDA